MGNPTLHRGYPDPLSDNATKLSDDYGLSIAKFIEHQWYYNEDDATSNNSGLNESYYQRRQRLEVLRSYKDGYVDTTPWRDLFNVSQDQAHQAFDWTYYNLVPKFIDIIRDRFPLEIFEIEAEGLDGQTLSDKEKHRKNIEDQMLSAPFAKAFSKGVGVDFTPQGYVPESEEEVDIIMSDYKEAQEIAIEVCLNKIFDINRWEPIYQLLLEDLIVYGFAVKSVTTSPNNVIEYNRVNPLNMIFSRDYQYSKDKRGCYYFGEIKIMRIDELQKRSNHKFSEKQLRSAIRGRAYGGVIGDPANSQNTDFFSNEVEVLRFAWKTTLNEVYKKKYKHLVRKEDQWKLHPDSKSKRVEGSFDVWLEGEYVIGSSELIYAYDAREDMIRSNKDMNEVMPPYILYSIDEPSMVDRLMLVNDDIHSTRLKINHLIYTMKPDGLAIDIDGLTEIDLASGGVLDPQGVLDYVGQRGDLLYSGTTLEGNRTGPPIVPITNGDMNKLNGLIAKYNQDLRSMYDITGINPVADGTAPTKGALIGVQQNALNAANTATKHILAGALSIMQRSCEATVSRIQNLSMAGAKYERAMMSLVGERVYKIMKNSAPLHLFEMGININIAPDLEQRDTFRASLDQAVQADKIDYDDRLELMDTKNLKLAKKSMKIKIEKRRRQKQQDAENLEKIRSQNATQAGLAIEQAKQQSLQMEIQANQSKLQAEAQKESMLLQYTRETDFMLQKQKYGYELLLKDKEVLANRELNKFKEDRKDDRTNIQADQQSKMIDQRQRDSGAVDFKTEAEIDKLTREAQVDPLQQGNQQFQQ